MAVPAERLTRASPSSTLSTRPAEEVDNPTIANATRRTTVSAAAAATTAIAANVPQAISTDEPLVSGGYADGGCLGRVVDVGRRDRRSTRGDVDPPGQGDPAQRDHEHAHDPGPGHPRGRGTHDRSRWQGEAPGERDPPGHAPVHRRHPPARPCSEDGAGAHLRG